MNATLLIPDESYDLLLYKNQPFDRLIYSSVVIQIVEGSVNPILYEQSWVNPLTNTTYKNVFGLASICTFPSNIKEGDEFYFTIPKNPVAQTCAQCKAYSPIPAKTINIEIYNK